MITHLDTPQCVCRFGISRRDITPPVGIYHRMWGAASHDRAAGIHRPLFATAMVLAGVDAAGHSDQIQVVVAIDHCLMTTPEMNSLLDAISTDSGIPRESLLVIFSHTHAAGLLSLDRVELPGGELLPDYFRTLARQVIAAVQEAKSQMQEASIVFGRASCDLAGHRDFYDEQSRQYVCGFNPAVPGDDTVIVARVTGAQGKVLATMVNYACHPTTLAWQNQLISPDFPGALRETIEQVLGGICLFVQGASGELGPREGYVGDPAVADRNGRQLAYASLARLVALPEPGTRFCYTGPVVSGATLGTWAHQFVPSAEGRGWSVFRTRRRSIAFPYRPGLPTVQSAESEGSRWQGIEVAARSSGDSAKAADARAMVERQTRLIARLKALPQGHYPLDTVVWRLGDAVWVAIPGEPYSLLQRRLRERFPNRPVIVSPLAFGWGPSYLPPAELYDQGLYQESIAVLAPGSLERLVDELAKDISACFA